MGFGRGLNMLKRRRSRIEGLDGRGRKSSEESEDRNKRIMIFQILESTFYLY